MSGAVSGVVGELTGDAARNAGINKQIGTQLAGLSGGLSSIVTGNLVGLDDQEVANNILSGQRIGANAAENNAYFALRPLKGSPWLGPLSHNSLDDKTNTEIAHEQLFFEDQKGGNIGFTTDGLREESGSILQEYRITESGFDDTLMRQAVQNVQPKPYSLLGVDSCTGKYNCQDWAEAVRVEYDNLLTERNLSIWNQMIKPQINLKSYTQ